VPFLAPLGLLGLLFVPLVVAFYILRLRRPQRTISSTVLWQKLVRDVEANAPWQRLRRSLLLLLQLLLVVALAFVVARPFSERPAGLSRDVVLVVDASASMSATDVFPDRLRAAKRAALEALADLPADGRVSVIAAGTSARVVANEATERSRIAAAIDSIAPQTTAADLADALKLAGALAARARGAEIVVVTDDNEGEAARLPAGADSTGSALRVDAPVRVITIGRDRHNQAIVALAVRADPSGVKRTVFVSVANLDTERVSRRLQLLADDVPVTARDLELDALRRTEVVIDELPAGTRIVEARLGPAGDAAAAAADPNADRLALDDRAWAIVPSERLRRILLVGPGNVYLQNALSLLPNVELYGATGEDYAGTTGKELFDLIVFDGYLPAELPGKPILAIAPPRSSALGDVDGTLELPAIGQLPSQEPLLRSVDLTRLHVAEAQKLTLPPWARVVIPGPESAPLLYSGLRQGLPTAVLAFDLRKSDLPLQVAWPVLAANLAGELLGLDSAATEPLAPGTPVDLPLPAGAGAVRVTQPDGTTLELAPGGRGASTVTYVATDQLGVYHSEPVYPPGVTPAGRPETPSEGASPTSTAASSGASGEASASAASGTVDFAVDLFDAEESNIAPGDGSRITAVGTAGAGTSEPGLARSEWWIPLALLALVLLLLEWLVYERDGARRLRASLGEIVRRPRHAILGRRGR
jgi:hypothetical protein